MTNSINN